MLRSVTTSPGRSSVRPTRLVPGCTRRASLVTEDAISPSAGCRGHGDHVVAIAQSTRCLISWNPHSRRARLGHLSVETREVSSTTSEKDLRSRKSPGSSPIRLRARRL